MRRRDTAAICALVVFSILPFIDVWHFSAIGIDDPQYFMLPQEVVHGLTPASVKWAFTDLSNAIWMPFTWIMYQADHTLCNTLLSAFPSVDGFRLAYSIAHIQSMLLHSANTVLLFFFLRMLDGKRRLLVPLMATLFWAVHPLRVESVAWIASLKDTLSLLFLLLALIMWVRFRETEGRKAYVLSHIAFVFACCAKPSAMVFPWLIFLLDVLWFGVLTCPSMNWRKYRKYFPSLLISIAVSLLAQIAQSVGGATLYQSSIPLWYRVCNAIVSIGVYVRNLVCPIKLAPQCAIQWPHPPHFAIWGGMIGLAVVVIAIIMVTKISKQLKTGVRLYRLHGTTGLLWFLGAIAPTLGISAFGGHAFADRFTYIPAIGASIALLSIGAKTELNIRMALSHVIMAAAIAAIGVVSWRQTQFWQDDGTLMPRILEVDGDDNFMAHVCYAKHLYEHRRNDADLRLAERHFTTGYRLNPAWCRSSSLLYMFLLGECGKVEALREVQNGFINWLRTRHNLWKSLDQDISEGIVALYGNDRQKARPELARKIADALLACGRNDIPQLYYFVVLTGDATEDSDMKRVGLDGLKRISDPWTGYDNPYRFRFVLAKCRKEDMRRRKAGK